MGKTEVISPSEDDHNLSMASNFNIVVCYDNYEYKKGFQASWGFSCFVGGDGKKVLFDTGGEGTILLANMDKLGIYPDDINSIVLSHIHGDHTGGIFHLLEKKQNVVVYLPESFPEEFKNKVKKAAQKVVEVQSPIEICKGMYISGEMGSTIKEQALVLNTDQGLAVITGCAHPGIVNIVEKVKDLFRRQVLLVMGGFHLKNGTENEIKEVIEALKDAGVQYVAASHCTGQLAREMLAQKYLKNCIETGLGSFFRIPEVWE